MQIKCKYKYTYKFKYKYKYEYKYKYHPLPAKLSGWKYGLDTNVIDNSKYFGIYLEMQKYICHIFGKDVHRCYRKIQRNVYVLKYKITNYNEDLSLEDSITLPPIALWGGMK